MVNLIRNSNSVLSKAIRYMTRYVLRQFESNYFDSKPNIMKKREMKRLRTTEAYRFRVLDSPNTTSTFRFPEPDGVIIACSSQNH